MKQLKDRLPEQVNAALAELARAAEGWATKVRSLFAVLFAALAIWMWNHPSNAKYLYLLLTAAWMTMAAIGASLKKSSEPNFMTMTMIDLTIVHLGLAGFVWQGLFPAIGSGVYLCYFPILAIAANRYRLNLLIKTGLYAGLGYGLISLLSGNPPWFRVAILFTTVYVFMMGLRAPRNIAVSIAGKAIEDAFALGSKQKEIDLVAQAHQLILPPPIVDLPQIWVSSKHGAGSENSGDYFQIFDTSRGPLVIVGDLGGQGLKALGEVGEMNRRLSAIVNRVTSLPKILQELNAYFWEKYQGSRPFTCVLAEWEGEQLRYINAGHLPLIQMSKPQGAQIIGHKQLPVTCGAVGTQAEGVFTESITPFPVRDQLVIYTDGVFAKMTDDRDKGVSEIESLVEKFSGAEVTTLCHRIFDCAQTGYDQNKDDSTVVVIRRQPASASTAAEGKAAG